MPRPADYLIEGYTYHLTDRCHNGEFLLSSPRDRDVYRRWLFEGVRRYKVPVFGCCITSNHVHVVVRADRTRPVSDLMRLASGSTAKRYNIRNERNDSMWEHPYKCTVVQDGRHLLNCLCYAHLNMVRAGVVAHPSRWKWCGHDEIIGKRERYRILDMDRLLESMEMHSAGELRDAYETVLTSRLEAGGLEREAVWTESLAVGTKGFVEKVKKRYGRRTRYTTTELDDPSGETFMVREDPGP